ncbi:uncharacterized protein LOC113310676 [Papaver somniferum]|uniref:uncharacterized protein LOC113310676 n=1 Tax=Papaver somniferum TaxID=3469 RepID=UPI000E701B3F|nr:uncharacterized protein LOC113310676 [Papaver somniferum]
MVSKAEFEALTKQLTSIIQSNENLAKEVLEIKAKQDSPKLLEEFKDQSTRSGGPILNNPLVHNTHERIVGQFLPGENSNFAHTHKLKVDVPRFDGVNSRSWVRKCTKYFQLHQMNEEQKVHVASMYLEGKTDVWLHDYQVGKEVVRWETFMKDICSHFQELGHDDIVGEFNKLSQVGTVSEYQEIFEEFKALMLAKNKHLTEDYFTSSFISGLKEELRIVVQMFSPATLEKAIYLARMHEMLLDSSNKKAKINRPPPLYIPQSHMNTVHSPKSTSPSPRGTIPTSPKFPPIRRLTYAEMKTRKDKGLCYNCDEEFKVGHKYKDVEISVHALAGNTSPSTIKVHGMTLNKHAITILVDSGRTHNFLDPEITRLSGRHVEPTANFQVALADGNKLVSSSKCPNFQWAMQNNNFQLDMRILPLGGCDMVLGVGWMKGISLVKFDFKKLTITFSSKGKDVMLQGITESSILSLMTGKEYAKYRRKHKHGLMGHLFSISGEEKQSLSPPSLQPLLDSFKSIFQEPTHLPPTRSHDHHIPLQPLSSPPNQRPYRIPFIQKYVVEKLVQEMLASGVIRPSHSPFSSPILLVKKKDGSWRFCVDYRRLNELTIKNKYPIHVIDEILDELKGAKVFYKIDLRDGYHHIRVSPADIQKTAFKTHQGHYEFLVIPYGLTNAPASFQTLMKYIFQPYLRKFILVFFDDILIYSPNVETHIKHLTITLELLKQHSLFGKIRKCSFGQSQIDYVGHIIFGDGVAADPEKIACMVKWPVPNTLRDLRGFLGITGYYRKFVKDYGLILATNACDVGVGGALMQEKRPIVFFSKGMGSGFLAMSTYEKEMMAIVLAVSKWRTYLLGNKFTIYTYHQSIKYFMDQRIHSVLQQKWLSKLLDYTYELKYRKGADNLVVDALSRVKFGGDSSCHALTQVQPSWLQGIQDSHIDDAIAGKWIPELTTKSQETRYFIYQQGILRYKKRIYIGQTGDLRKKVLEALHSSPVGGHSGGKTTYQKAKLYFYWAGMKQHILTYVMECDVSQQHKNFNTSPVGMLQPPPIPNQDWEHICMDFITGLPKSEGREVILVVFGILSSQAGIHAVVEDYLHQRQEMAQVLNEAL